VKKSGDVLQIPALGLRVELRKTAEDTGGELLEIDVIGRTRGFLNQEHVHTGQEERHEVIGGRLNLVLDGVEHLLRPGDRMKVPAGTPHRQLPGGEGEGHVRIQVRPAGQTQAFLERLAELSATGQIGRLGFPRPVAGAQLVHDFGAEGHASRPPLAVQQGLARAILALQARAQGAGRAYVFVDEWDVAAPAEAVFDAVSDARSYPEWWTPVYIDVESDGPAAVGKESRQHFKGRLPYHLHTRSTITRLEPPRLIQADVVGDLAGRGTWTLTPADGGTHVRFDWEVHADRKLLKLLTPVLRPLFRWNHDWAIERAKAGLEPYAQRTAARRLAAAAPEATAAP
jgi:uncharacterized protein YndB with AHSA1/START domain/mannose-6-phosphate isomerase-like protein (cupin superfamily)